MFIRLSTVFCVLLLLSACSGLREDEPVQTAPIVHQQPNIMQGDLFPTAERTNTEEYFVNTVGDRVFYAFDSAVLNDASQMTLQRQAQWLRLLQPPTRARSTPPSTSSGARL